MSNEDDEYCFNEEKARKCVYYLLKNDTASFKKFIPEIKVMDSDSFENLFQGTPFKNKNDKDDEDDGYDYKVKNKKQFAKLLDKFDNFSIILENWYLDEKYYEYLKELWVKYISIENLKGREDKKLEEILKNNQINYTNWPEDIKNDFKTKINNTSNTRIMAIKSVLENELSEFNNVIKELNAYKKTLEQEKEKEKENEVYKENAGKLIKQLLVTATIFAIGKVWNTGLEAIEAKRIRSFKKYILNYNEFGLNESKVNCLVDRLLESIEGESANQKFTLRQNCSGECYWFQNTSKTCLSLEETIDAKICDGKLNHHLESCQEYKAFLKNNAVCGMHAALSFLNLVWSIYELKSTFDGFNQIKEYKKRFEDIKNNFNSHKNSIGILPDDPREASKKIQQVLTLIWEDEKQLNLLIKDINQSIHNQEEQQKTAIIGTAASVVLGAAGVAGSILTCNVTSAIYTASTVMNVIGGIGHASSYIVSKKIVNELQSLLKEAEDKSKEFQKEIDNLLKKLGEITGEIPKFNLSESFSSISTNA